MHELGVQPSSTLSRAPQPWPTVARALLVVGLLYAFLVGVSLLESGIAALGEGFQAGLIESVDNPLAGLFAGVLATVLVQSSSVTTATLVGLVGAGTLGLEAAVPMIMGANIGTTVTNTLASLGHVRNPLEFRRAFAGATVHDMFNVMAVAILLPLELATGFLSSSASAVAEVVRGWGLGGTETSSPIKEAVKFPAGLVNDALAAVLSGPALGIAVVVLALGIIFVALSQITSTMRVLIAARVEASLNRVVGHGAGLMGMVVGAVVTVLVQSSSITTSILVPLMGAGILRLSNAFPITLGANVGTTVTALLASLAVESPAGLVLALTHTLFNVVGIIVIYPFPPIRAIPLRAAEALAGLAVRRRSTVVAYIVTAFVLIPLAGIALL